MWLFVAHSVWVAVVILPDIQQLGLPPYTRNISNEVEYLQAGFSRCTLLNMSSTPLVKLSIGFYLRVRLSRCKLRKMSSWLVKLSVSFGTLFCMRATTKPSRHHSVCGDAKRGTEVNLLLLYQCIRPRYCRCRKRGNRFNNKDRTQGW